MDLESLRHELELARQERAALLEHAAALEPHLGGALQVAANGAPPLYQTSGQPPSHRAQAQPAATGPRKLSWGSPSPARQRPAPQAQSPGEGSSATAASLPSTPPDAHQWQQQQTQQHEHHPQANGFASEADFEAGHDSETRSSVALNRHTGQSPCQPVVAAAQPRSAAETTLPTLPGASQEAGRKQAFREVLALLLGEGPGSSKLDHLQLTAASVAAVAREAANSAAAMARQQGEQAAMAAVQDRTAKAGKEATERAQRDAAKLRSEAEASQAALSAQVSKLQAQVDALQREKKALEGKAAQQGREARSAADGVKAAREQAEAAEKLAERRAKDAARGQAEAQKLKQDLERRVREAEQQVAKSEEATAMAQKQAAAAAAEAKKAAKRADEERAARVALEAAAQGREGEQAEALAVVSEAQRALAEVAADAERQLQALRADLVSASGPCTAALPVLRQQVACLRQEAGEQLAAAQQQAAQWGAATAEMARYGGIEGVVGLQRECWAAHARVSELEVRVEGLEAAKRKLAAERAQMDAELRMINSGQAEMRRELAAAEAALLQARKAAEAAEARATAAEAAKQGGAGRAAEAEARAEAAGARATRAEEDARAARDEAGALRVACEQLEALQRELEARAAAAEASSGSLRDQLASAVKAARAAEQAGDVRVAALVRGLRSRYFRDPTPGPEQPGRTSRGANSSSGVFAKGSRRPPSGAQRPAAASVRPPSACSESASSTKGSAALGSPLRTSPGGSARDGLRMGPGALPGVAEEETDPGVGSGFPSVCSLNPDEVMGALEAFIGRQAAALELQGGTPAGVECPPSGAGPASAAESPRSKGRDGVGHDDDTAGACVGDQQVASELLWLEGCLLYTLVELREQSREAEALRQQMQALENGLQASPGAQQAGQAQTQQTQGSARPGARAGAGGAAAGLEAAGSGVGGSPARSLAAQMMRAMAAERAELQRRLARLEASASGGSGLRSGAAGSLGWVGGSAASLSSTSGSVSSYHGHPNVHGGVPSSVASPSPAPFTAYMPLRRSLSARSTPSSHASPGPPASPRLPSPASASQAGTGSGIGAPHHRGVDLPHTPPGQAPGYRSPVSAAAQDKARRSSDPAGSLCDLSYGTQRHGRGSGFTDPAQGPDSGIRLQASRARGGLEAGGAGQQAWAEGTEGLLAENACLDTQVCVPAEESTLSLASTVASGPGRQAQGRPEPPACAVLHGAFADGEAEPSSWGGRGGSAGSPLKVSYDVEEVMAILEGLGDVLPSAQVLHSGGSTQGLGAGQAQQQFKPVGMGGSLLGPSSALLPSRAAGSMRSGHGFLSPAWDGTTGAPMQALSSYTEHLGGGASVGMYGRVAAGRGSPLVGGRGLGSRQLTPYLAKQRQRSTEGSHL